MAAWLEFTRLFWRSELRRAQPWRKRVVVATLGALVGAWAALAPQAQLAAAERMRLGCNALLVFGLGAGVLGALRRRPAILAEVANSQARLAFVTVCLGRGVAAAAVALPLLMLPLGMGMVRWEHLGSMAPWRRSGLEVLLMLLVAAHLWVKGIICRRASDLAVANLADELVTGASIDEICARLRMRSWRQARPLIFMLTAGQAALLLALPRWPNVPLSVDEMKFLQVLLVAGIGLLFLDASALRWRGAWLGIGGRSVAPTLLFTLGTPWAVAWVFLSLHSGEKLGSDAVIAFFALWLAIGLVVSSLVGAGAKAKLQAGLRELVSERI